MQKNTAPTTEWPNDHKMFEQLSHNLNMLMAESRISAMQLSKNTGLPATTIKRIRNNDNANPTLTSLLPIAKFFGVSVSQLIGDEDMPTSRAKGAFIVNEAHWHQVPVINWELAPLWKENAGVPVLEFASTDKEISPNTYALVVEEENWQNLAPGTVLIVDPLLKPEHRDFAIVHKEGQATASLKQVLLDDGKTYLRPVVQDYPLTAFTTKHRFLGVVIEYRMRLKKLKHTLLSLISVSLIDFDSWLTASLSFL